MYKILYMHAPSETEKEIRWVGSAYDDLLAFPNEPRKKAGFQLGKVQAGLDPEDWKPFDDVGTGTKEIRIKDSQGIYRVMYSNRESKCRFLNDLKVVCESGGE